MSAEFDPAAVRDQVLDEAAVQRLRSVLKQRAVPEGGMSLEMVDGLFSAIIVAPDRPGSEEFLPLVLGDVAWSAAERAELQNLLGRLWNHIEARIQIDPDSGSGAFMPLLTFPANLPEDPTEFAKAITRFEFPLGAAWAGGFLHAVNLRLAAWTELQEAVPALKTSLGYLLRLIQIGTGDDGSEPPPPDERVAMMAAMPYLLRALAATRAAA